uniref:uncharacterized protein n=1 Tax=Centroberyx gerrardi TaxID=166262 RepID=UPI003AB0350A
MVELMRVVFPVILLWSKVRASMSGSDHTQLTVSSLDESQTNFSESVLQPEDQDEELEKSLSSQGSSLMELYPSTISQIGRAWHRQHVSEAADSVLRRYRRLRWLSNRSNLNHTFNITLRHTSSNPKKMNSKALVKMSSNSSLNRSFPRISNKRTDTALRSPLRTVTHLQDWQAERPSPGREGGSLKRDQRGPVLVMDFCSSGISSAQESSEPEEISLNQTFTVPQVSDYTSSSQQREQPTTLTISPITPCYPTTDASMDPSPRSNRLSLPTHAVQRAFTAQRPGCPMNVMETSAVVERSNIHYSPVRQGPLKTRLMAREGHGGSPYALSRSPRSDSLGSYSRELKKPRSMSAAPSSPLQRSTMLPRRLYPQDSYHPFQPKLYSPQSSAAAGQHRLKRRLSFDTSFLSSSVSYSPVELEDEFQKLYHRFVCQGKSSLSSSRPCHVCARSSEASRGHSSSALAALALSPHRSILRKRHRELDRDSHPQSKRSRDGYCAYSPGSKRHGKELLRHLFSPAGVEASHDNLSYRCSNDAMAQTFSVQQPSTRREGWMTLGRPASSAEFSGPGNEDYSQFVDSKEVHLAEQNCKVAVLLEDS